MLLHHMLSSNLEGISDQYKNLGNCPPTSPLIQRFALSETSVCTLSLRAVGWLFPRIESNDDDDDNNNNNNNNNNNDSRKFWL